MSNVLCFPANDGREVGVRERVYDLKGSTAGRSEMDAEEFYRMLQKEQETGRTTPNLPTLLDNDYITEQRYGLGIHIHETDKERIMNQMLRYTQLSTQ